ncbi:MAG: CNNM domain-containing protein [bacterium]
MLSVLIVIAFCLTANAFFAGIETGVISLNRMQLRHRVDNGDRAAARLQEFLDHPDRLLATTLVGVNLAMVMVAVLAGHLGTEVEQALTGRSNGYWGETLANIAMMLIVLVFAEYLPKAWFQSDPLPRCSRFARLLVFSEHLLRPLGNAMTWITQALLPGNLKQQAPRPMFVTKDELELLAHEGEEHGALSPKQRIMIRRVFALTEKKVVDIMIPAAQIVRVTTDTTVQQFLDQCRGAKFNRFPVYNKAQQAYTGVVNIFDVFAANAPDTAPLAPFVQPPLFVAASAPLTEVFTLLRRSRRRQCLVTGHSGAVVGIVTTETILREIVGQM